MEQEKGEQSNMTKMLIDQARIIVDSLNEEDFDVDDTFGLAYSNKDSPVLYTRILEMLRNRAKKLGIAYGAFDKRWKAFLYEKQQEERDRQEEHVTLFTGQPLQLKCGRYICNDGGIWKTEPDRFGNSVEICVCPHPIMPVRRLVNIETGDVQWVLAYRRGGMWRSETVEKQSVTDKGSIIKALGRFDIAINSNNALPFVQYLNDIMEYNREAIPEDKSISRLGWVDGYGFSPYVEGLHYDSNGQFRTEYEAISQAGSWEAWRDMYKAVRSGKNLAARLVFAAAAVSPFVSRLGALPFFYHIWGSQSGIGKTVAIMAATSVWANPEQGLYNKTCNSTDVGFEQMAAFCNHLPLILDELQELRTRVQSFDKLIYSLCEGVERMRGAKDGGIRQTRRWRNVIITCGESPITSTAKGAGAIARVIEVESQESLFEDAPTLSGIVKENYGWAGKKILDALADTDSGLSLEKIQAWRSAYYEELDAKDKQAMAMSLLMTGDAILGWLIQEPEFTNLTVSQTKPLMRSQAEMNVNLDCYYYVCEWIGGNAGHFDRLTVTKDNPGELYGRWDDENDKLVYVLNRVMTDVIRDAKFDPKAFYSWAKANGLIKVNGTKTNGHPYGYHKRGLFKRGDYYWTIALLTGQEIPRKTSEIKAEED